MNQIWENKKNLNFGTDFSLFDPNMGPQTFFGGYTSTST